MLVYYKTPSLEVRQEGKNIAFTILDQRRLPYKTEHLTIIEPNAAIDAIKQMAVRGAPLIGAVGALALLVGIFQQTDFEAARQWTLRYAPIISQARPTAVNLQWAIKKTLAVIENEDNLENYQQKALAAVLELLRNEEKCCENIGLWGLPLIEEIARKKKGEPVQILTHCNAGTLACLKWGTATAPIYMAQQKKIPLHVWVDETRPRNQGYLTAWELKQAQIPHTVIVDNAGGYLMQKGLVDIVIVGSDRTARNGDVANKIGTYLKALTAKAHQIPFYVALPSSTFDFSITNGFEIEIETRSEDEITHTWGILNEEICQVRLTQSPAYNPAFDITPAHLITGLITERGICAPTPEAITKLFPETIKT
jgi:methylthioribose-1-phosphate isomerase